jgi:very-short-patch-repair endonuclease
MSICIECGKPLTYKVVEYSSVNYGVLLCIEHQNWIEYISTVTTEETIRLYCALKERGVPAQIEKFDGYKHIDIAIPEAKVNIEVDGRHHNYNKNQALSDLKRTYHSFLKGYHTLRIPNSLVYDDDTLEETADYIVQFLNESLKKLNK